MRDDASHKSAQHSHDSGMAMVLVLWIILAIALQVTVLTRGLRDSIRIGANETQAIRRDLAIHAAVETAAARLSAPDQQRRWTADGQQRSLTVAGARVQVRLSDEAGRININTGDEKLLAAAFTASGVTDPARAAAFADRVIDWRDADDERRQRGAERQDYRRASLPYGPANMPFHHVSDIGRVLEVSPDVADRLAAIVTVHGRDDKINPSLAPDGVFFALPGVDATLAERARAARARGDTPAMEAALSPAAAYFSTSRGPIYRIEMDVQLDTGPAARVEVVIAVGADPAAPYHVLAWSDVKPGRLP